MNVVTDAVDDVFVNFDDAVDDVFVNFDDADLDPGVVESKMLSSLYVLLLRYDFFMLSQPLLTRVRHRWHTKQVKKVTKPERTNSKPSDAKSLKVIPSSFVSAVVFCINSLEISS